MTTPTKQDPSATSSIVDTFTPNDWVLVRYLTQTYPGIVTKVVGTEIEVSVIEKIEDITKHWKWPQKEDKILYVPEDVLCHIQHPEAIGSRGQGVFSKLPQ